MLGILSDFMLGFEGLLVVIGALALIEFIIHCSYLQMKTNLLFRALWYVCERHCFGRAFPPRLPIRVEVNRIAYMMTIGTIDIRQ